MSKSVFDIAVIGSGILGLSHAAAAASRGLKVIVLERGGWVQQASVRNFGLLTSLYDGGGEWGNRALRSRDIYESWSAESRGGIPLVKSGSLQLAQSPHQLQLLQAYESAASTLRYPVQFFDAHQCRELAPSLCPQGDGFGKILGGLHFPGDALLEPRLMFSRTSGLPALLERRGVTFQWFSPVVSLRSSDCGGVTLTTSSGDAIMASKALVCSGEDVVTLLPGVFKEEGSDLRLCKLQMLRVALPTFLKSTPHPPPMPITSGLSLRRYPGPQSLFPDLHSKMMLEDKEGRDGEAEALGIHVIARPALNLPRTPFGGVRTDAMGSGGLSSNEWIIGDSHEYSPATGQDVGMDEACDEGVTNEILRVAGSMLGGLGNLALSRSNVKCERQSTEINCRLLAQWCGFYLDHKRGIFSATLRVDSRGSVERVDGDHNMNSGNVHVITGIGGKGMTMSPALGEEFFKNLFHP